MKIKYSNIEEIIKISSHSNDVLSHSCKDRSISNFLVILYWVYQSGLFFLNITVMTMIYVAFLHQNRWFKGGLHIFHHFFDKINIIHPVTSWLCVDTDIDWWEDTHTHTHDISSGFRCNRNELSNGLRASIFST